jgi:hypothetical protein
MRPGWLIRARSEERTTHRRRQTIRLEILGERTLCGGGRRSARSLTRAGAAAFPALPWSVGFPLFVACHSGCKEGERLMKKIEISGCAAEFAPETAKCGQENRERKARQFLPLSLASSSGCLGEQLSG